ncbi:MAG: arginine--tRNA ligase [Candidatus Latescibacterota bacterium]
MKIQQTIERHFAEALDSLGLADSDTRIILEKPRQKNHGDISSPLAMSLAKKLKKNPLDLADKIVGAVSFPKDIIADVCVAPPGFINLTFSREILTRTLSQVLSLKDRYGSSQVGRNQKCQVEYVSANPTGPLVIVSARAAAIGSTIVNLLRFIGFDAHGEYYVNDYGNQVRALGESLRYRARELAGELDAGEEIGAYPGEYLKDIAEVLDGGELRKWEAGDDPVAKYGEFATAHMLAGIKADMNAFGVEFDEFYFESSLHPEWITKCEKLIEQKKFAYEKDGAKYFKSSELGDEKDRVLRKSDGNPTYFLGDIAYHLTKLQRGYTKVVDIWGPDHHGHIPRMKAAAHVIGAPPDWLEVDIVGWVRLIEKGQPVSMSKRAGEFITLRELIDDVGKDVAKYFFLMRRANSPLDFDLDLARTQSDENPVYYVQYAHARISSVLQFAAGKGFRWNAEDADLTLLSTESERALMVHIAFLPAVIEGAALTREAHRLTVYAQELAALFHQFYHEHKIVSDDTATSAARLLLAEATMRVLRNTLHLMGVSAPRSM